MVNLRLTPPNLEFLKRRLQRLYPGVKAAHRTEALAAASGYRTYASLLSELRGTPREGHPLLEIDGARWSTRLAELGYTGLADNQLIAMLLSQELPDPCWMELTAEKQEVARSWFYRCKAEALPYVTLELARKYAKLEWDCITLDSANESHTVNDESGAIVRGLFATFQSSSAGSGARPDFLGSAFVGSIEGLQPDVARILAGEFFKALYQASRTSSRTAA